MIRTLKSVENNNLQVPLFVVQITSHNSSGLRFKFLMANYNLVSKYSVFLIGSRPPSPLVNQYITNLMTSINQLCINAMPHGGPRTELGTLLIVHFTVIVFPHWWRVFSSRVPSICQSQTPSRTLRHTLEVN